LAIQQRQQQPQQHRRVASAAAAGGRDMLRSAADATWLPKMKMSYGRSRADSYAFLYLM